MPGVPCGAASQKEMVIAAIAAHRRFDKPQPRYYAELTVEKAIRSLEHRVPRAEAEAPSQSTDTSQRGRN